MEPAPASSRTFETRQLNYPETDEIPPDQAKFLFEEHGAILVIENLPVGSEFGIDMVAYRVGERFKGVKMIPPGVHVVYASAVSEKDHRQSGPRCGFFYNFQPRELCVRRWSIREEDFDDSFEPDEDYKSRYSSNLRDLDRHLGAYRFSTYKLFLSLTSKISSNTVSDLMPTCKRIRAVPYLVRIDTEKSRSGRLKRVTMTEQTPNEEDLLPHLEADESTVIKFTKIPENHLDSTERVEPHKITEYNLDSTKRLDETFAGDDGRLRLLAEFQFAFVTLMFCQVYDCFEHWKKILGLVCQADVAVSKYAGFYREFVAILSAQLQQVPEDLFADIVDGKNLVRFYVDRLVQNINDSCAMPELKWESSKLQQLAEERFGWQFDLELDDERPVVVE